MEAMVLSQPMEPSPEETAESLLDASMSAVVFDELGSARLSALVLARITERKDADNTTKRVWIYKHLLDHSCEKCGFLPEDELIEGADGKPTFRIRNRCISSHFRVSVNTPFNWLIRDFQRVHAPHSQEVAHRKDLREIYYDEFGLFRRDMKVTDFLSLAQKLQGRPTGAASQSKRKRSLTLASASSPLHLQAPPKYARSSFAVASPADHRMDAIPLVALPVLTPTTANDTNATERNSSRLVLLLWVSNLSQVFMFREKLNMELQKTSVPYELPTFRPEFGTKYDVGRKDPQKHDEEVDNPNKLFIEDIRLSRNHLMVTWSQAGWMAEDLNSYGGTMLTRTEVMHQVIDGKEVAEEVKTTSKMDAGQPVELRAGDVLSLSDGIVTLTVAQAVHGQPKAS